MSGPGKSWSRVGVPGNKTKRTISGTSTITGNGGKSGSTQSLQIRQLKSNKSNEKEKVKRSDSNNSQRDGTSGRSSYDSLHSGKPACTVTSHDDLHRKNLKLVEKLKAERETNEEIKNEYEQRESIMLSDKKLLEEKLVGIAAAHQEEMKNEIEKIRKEYDQRESLIIRQKADLEDNIDEFHKDRTLVMTRHEREISSLAEKHKDLKLQIERNHQKEIQKIEAKNIKILDEKTKIIDNLKRRIAEQMKGDSSQRQNQIEELRKKLIEAAKEANHLREAILSIRSENHDSFKSGSSNNSLKNTPLVICQNCIILQHTLEITNQALKKKSLRLREIDENANKMRLGLQLNDLALESLDKKINNTDTDK